MRESDRQHIGHSSFRCALKFHERSHKNLIKCRIYLSDSGKTWPDGAMKLRLLSKIPPHSHIWNGRVLQQNRITLHLTPSANTGQDNRGFIPLHDALHMELVVANGQLQHENMEGSFNMNSSPFQPTKFNEHPEVNEKINVSKLKIIKAYNCWVSVSEWVQANAARICV